MNLSILASMVAFGCILTAAEPTTMQTVPLVMGNGVWESSKRYIHGEIIPFAIADGQLRMAPGTDGWLVDRNGDGRLDEADNPTVHPFLSDPQGARDTFTIPVRCGTTVWQRIFRLHQADDHCITMYTDQCLTTRVDGTLLHLVDDDCNGRFDRFGTDAVYIDAQTSTAGSYIPPLTPLVHLGDRWVEIAFTADGSGLTWRPYTGPLATVTLVLEPLPPGTGVTDPSCLGKLVRTDLKAAITMSRPGVYRLPPGDYHLTDGYEAQLPPPPPEMEIVDGRVVEVTTTVVTRLMNHDQPQRLTIPAEGLVIRRGLFDRLTFTATTDGNGSVTIGCVRLEDGHGGTWPAALWKGSLVCLAQKDAGHEPVPLATMHYG